ncbi:MAG: hypothetical protein RIS09_235, partial [Actinomycetota bacterium]
MERVTGIEPAQPAWKAGTLPLSYTRAPGWISSGGGGRAQWRGGQGCTIFGGTLFGTAGTRGTPGTPGTARWAWAVGMG